MRSSTHEPQVAVPERARTPRYESIFRQLAAEIRDGRYPVGSKLPSELALCERFGASRHTLREAIRRLTENGLIRRRAGSGTVVLRRTRSGGFTQNISALPDLISYVKGARLQVLDRRDVRADAQEARMLKCRRGQAWHKLCALKYLRGRRSAVAYLLAYVHRDHPALRDVFDRGSVGLHDFIEERICQAIALVEQEFAARPISARESSALGVPKGCAGFVIVRRYYSAEGTIVLGTYTIFPHDLMSYSMALRTA
jgi:DNA-binding GntR family transcriptional regulator